MVLERPPAPARAAQPPGKTYLKYSPDGKRMVVAGCADYARSFRTNDLGEPDMINNVHDDTLAVACGNDYIVLGSEDGTVCEFKIPEGSLSNIIVRFSLPIRDVALSPDEKWLAASSDEIELKIVNRNDIEQIYILRDHPKPIKHLTFDPSGRYLAASCANGTIYIYGMKDQQGKETEPTLVRTIEGVISAIEPVEEASSACIWHPEGKAFACATAVRDIVVVSVEDGAQQRSFQGGHDGDITAIAWSPNGALLASAGKDDKLVIWDTKTQKIIRQNKYEKILNVAFHSHGQNILNWTTSWGEAYICPNFFSGEPLKLLEGPKIAAPFYHDPASERSGGGAAAATVNGARRPLAHHGRAQRANTPDSLDELLGPAPEEDYDWIEDDDGAGYINGNGKRPRNNGDDNEDANVDAVHDKRARRAIWQPQIHEPFQPGATPWRGNRKYLCLNLIGFVWTVDQDTHHTVTVEFYDREMYRDFHFTDYFKYDKAVLNEHGVLFAAPPTSSPSQRVGDGSNRATKDDQPAQLFYRPHETWTQREDIRISLPDLDEEITCIALSNKYIIANTSKNYVRVWTLFGTPVKIWRMKSSPAVTCAAFGDFVMTVGNGPVAADGCTQLTYSIDDIRRDETCQSEDLIALGTLPLDSLDDVPSLRNVFWSDAGDPCIYDSTGVLLVLMHWRTPGQAKWVPLLDTKSLDRLSGGRKQETYWPVAVAGERFHCIILKGMERQPWFPKPHLTEFDLKIPVNRPVEKTAAAIANGTTGEDEDDLADGAETNAQATVRLEESYVRSSILHTLLDDAVHAGVNNHGTSTHTQKTEVARREIELDKLLLQLLAVECREGEDRGMKALEIVRLLRDTSAQGRMIEAAAKVAGRWGRGVLEDKIRELGERRMMGVEADED